MTVKEKRSGDLKGCFVADGRKQRFAVTVAKKDGKFSILSIDRA